MAGRVTRPIFRRTDTFVAVRPIHLGGGKMMEPGQELEGFRTYHLRSLYNRRRIGPKDHPWTELMLEAKTGFPKLMPKEPVADEDQTDEDQTDEDQTDEDQTDEDQTDEADQTLDDAEDDDTEEDVTEDADDEDIGLDDDEDDALDT